MRYLKILLLTCLFLFPLYAGAFAPPAKIQLESKDWGDANPDDIKTVLDSVVEAISPYMEGRQFGNILVRNGTTGPISIYDRGPNGEYIIMLNVHGRYWAQLTYQFSHEMCHLMSNYDLAPRNISHQQWFEESLCEAFSLFTLEKMTEHWHDNPPYPQWKEYARKFLEYEQDNLKQEHRRLPKGMKLPTWYLEYQKALSADPYAQGRSLNELVANQLLPIFDANPETWGSINYLNLGDDTDDKSLDKYLTDWQKSVPPKWLRTVKEVKQKLLETAG